MVSFRKKKGSDKAIPMSSKRKGIPKNKIANIPEGTHLSREELNKKLMERQIRIADIATADEIRKGDARLVSLNEQNSELDNIVVANDSPVTHDEVDLVKNPKLREQELKAIQDREYE